MGAVSYKHHTAPEELSSQIEVERELKMPPLPVMWSQRGVIFAQRGKPEHTRGHCELPEAGIVASRAAAAAAPRGGGGAPRGEP